MAPIGQLSHDAVRQSAKHYRVIIAVVALLLFGAIIFLAPVGKNSMKTNFTPTRAVSNHNGVVSHIRKANIPVAKSESRTCPGDSEHSKKKLNYAGASCVPKVIHQSWKDKNVPRIMQSWQKSWQTNHPTWTYKLWTDKDNRDFVKSKFPTFLTTYDKYPTEIFRADAVRYLYLYEYGGVYTDIDFSSVRPLDTLFENNSVNVILGMSHFGGHAIMNAWMASVRRHPFWLVCIELMQEYQQQIFEAKGVIEVGDVFKLTGPELLMDAVEEYTMRYGASLDDVTMLPFGSLYQAIPEIRNACAYQEPWTSEGRCIELSQKAYAVHHNTSVYHNKQPEFNSADAQQSSSPLSPTNELDDDDDDE